MRKLFVVLFLIMGWNVSSFCQDKDSIVSLPEVVITSTRGITKEVNKSFSDKFPGSYDVVWRRLNKDFLVKFMEIDVKHQALFRKNGMMKYDIIYMGESHLPRQIADRVNEVYEPYSIINAARVDRAGQVFWIVNLESAKSFKVIRVEEDGQLEEVKHYVKPTT